MTAVDCIVFVASGVTFALPTAAVREIVPLPKLWQPPTMPPALLGVLNLHGNAIPVLRLDRLLGLEPGRRGWFAPLMVLRAGWAVAADRVLDVELGAPVQALPPTTFNRCVDGIVSIDGGNAHLLAPERLLAEGEMQALRLYRDEAARRLADWHVTVVKNADE